MAKGGGGTTESVQKSEPWAPIQGHTLDFINRGQQLAYNGGPINTAGMSPAQRFAAMRGVTGGPAGSDAYADYLSSFGAPGQSVAAGAQLGMVPFTDLERQAQQGLVDYAGGGLPAYMTAGAGELGDVLSGSYLDQGNPHLEGMYRAATRPVIEDFNTEVLPALTSQFAMHGALNSGAHQNVATAAADDLQRNLLDTSAGIYGQNYEAERERMMRGMGLAPIMAGAEREMELGNLGLLGQVGGAERDLAGAMLGLPNQAAMEPWQRLNLYGDILGQGSGYGMTTAQEPYYQNTMAGALGGAMSGAGLGMMMGGPWAAAAGGLAGLGAGYFM